MFKDYFYVTLPDGRRVLCRYLTVGNDKSEVEGVNESNKEFLINTDELFKNINPDNIYFGNTTGEIIEEWRNKIIRRHMKQEPTKKELIGKEESDEEFLRSCGIKPEKI